MDYYLLTDMAAQIGYELAVSGAETFRIEETMRRVLAAYGIVCETFAIPNCVMVSLEADNGKPLMVMKRVGFHGNDLDAVERLNALSRRICAETPDPAVAAQWLEETRNDRRSYSVPVYYLGNLLAASGFCPVFGGTLRDSLWAGLMGLIIGFVTRRMDKLETNPFFSTIAAAFAMAVPAYLAAAFGLVDYADAVIIGSLMILVPGLLITNSMRDIIYGDTNSGVNRIVQVLLSALAIAMGTAAAWHITSSLYGQTAASTLSYPFWLQAIAIAVACTGFVQRPRLGALPVRARRRRDVDGVSAVRRTRSRSLRRKLHRRRGRRRLCRGHGPRPQVSGHLVSGHLRRTAAARRRYLLHHVPRAERQHPARPPAGLRHRRHRRQYRRRDPARLIRRPPVHRAAEKIRQYKAKGRHALRIFPLFFLRAAE